MKENKPAYQKPSVELIAMAPEGSLLLTASVSPATGGTNSSNAFGGSTIISTRKTARPATGGTNSSTAFGSGNVISSRK